MATQQQTSTAPSAPGPQPPGKQLTVTQQRRITLRNLFESQRPELSKLLPRGMDADRLFRMALTECIKNPKLLECTAESWALAIQTCAQQGLYPDSGLGYMYLVPRKNKKKVPGKPDQWVEEVSAMRGYQGDIKLARNTGEIDDIYAEVVYTKDTYRVTKGLNRNILHEEYEGDDDPGALRACYAVAKLVSGEVAFVTLRKRDVDRHRASSQGADSEYSPWQKHEAAMWKKTAIHELYKWLPKSSEAMEKAARSIAGEAPIDVKPFESATVALSPRSGLEGVTARLEEEAGLGEPAVDEGAESPETSTCDHPNVAPSKLEALPSNRSIVCDKCGEELRGEAQVPEREPGDDTDDEPGLTAAPAAENPRAAVEQLNRSAQTKGRQGRLQD